MYAVYKYAATTTQPGEYLALCVYLLTQCNVPPLADEKVDFLHFITMDAWLMALPEPERLDAADPAWFRRKVLFERVLKTQSVWIAHERTGGRGPLPLLPGPSQGVLCAVAPRHAAHGAPDG